MRAGGLRAYLVYRPLVRNDGELPAAEQNPVRGPQKSRARGEGARPVRLWKRHDDLRHRARRELPCVVYVHHWAVSCVFVCV